MQVHIEPIRKGMIMIWAGTAALVPSGFVLCDGNNSSPDLRNNFVIGAGDAYAVNDDGGAATHTQDFIGDGHVHFLQAGVDVGAGTDFDAITTDGAATGTTDAGDNLPPYYALCYIMKT